VSDTLPAGGDLDWSLNPSFTGCAINGSVGSQTLDCSLGDIAGGGSVGPIHIESSTTKADCGTVSNEASVSTDNDGSDKSSDSVDVQCADIAITKTANPTGPVAAGSTIGFDITVDNNGTGTAKGVTVSDTLPAGAGNDLNWSLNPAFTGCAINGSVGSQTLDCSLGDIAGGGSVGPIHIESGTTTSDCGTVSNTASVSTDNDGSDSSTASVGVTGCGTAQLTPTGTTCQQFTSGTAATEPSLFYTLKGTKVASATPGVFFYWTAVTAPSAAFTVDIGQSNTSSNSFPNIAVQSVSVFTSSCNSYKSATSSVNSDSSNAHVSVTKATAGAVYIIAVKYSPSSLKGATKPSPATITYSYATKLNGSLVGTSQKSIPLAPKP
jgi:uncharacterized repeat protein (TIGR01451 family)